ncbi:MAG TPA: hypothetical protein VGP72_03640 [Planctomycetota bacterium]|jgi:hypothetical protein
MDKLNLPDLVPPEKLPQFARKTPASAGLATFLDRLRRASTLRGSPFRSPFLLPF